MSNKIAHVERLKELDACPEAVEYAAKFKDPQEGWDACENPEWMLWLAAKLSGNAGSAERKKLALCACECARLALPYVSAGEGRPLNAIEVADEDNFGPWLAIRTGPEELSHEFASRIGKYGYGFRDGFHVWDVKATPPRMIPEVTEEQLFKMVGLPFQPPEER